MKSTTKLKLFIACVLFLSIICNGKSQTSTEIETLYGQGNFKDVISKGKSYLINNPNDTIITYYVACSYVAIGDYKNSISYLDFCITNTNPKNPEIKAWALNYRGISRFFNKDYTGSYKDFNDCIALKATPKSLNSSQKNKYIYFKNADTTRWKVIETNYLRCYFFKTDPTANNQSFITAHDSAYSKICRFFDTTLQQKIDCFFWADTAEARICFGGPLGFASPAFFQINSHLYQSKGHELAHVISYQATSPTTRSRLINEGLARFLDQVNRNHFTEAKLAMKGEKVIIADFWSNTTIPETKMYPVASAFIEYISNNGTKQQLLRLLKCQTRDTAMSVYSNYTTLEKEFERKFLSAADTTDTISSSISNFNHSNIIFEQNDNYLSFKKLAPKSQIIIYNLQGTILFSKIIFDNTFTLNSSLFMKGLYIITIFSDNKKQSFKYVK